MFCLMIVVVCSDVGGYVAGVFFASIRWSRRSPQEVLGGIRRIPGGCVVGGVATVTFILDANPLVGVLLGVALVFTATLGDLIESQVKRELGIKDMGTLLPGHGGIMDRLDSLLPSAFVTWLVLTVLV
ncbi:hypothetical protein GS436_14385 [Rhodococcus hoagii]|nr:hypothetical protein [Prescottella equi]